MVKSVRRALQRWGLTSCYTLLLIVQIAIPGHAADSSGPFPLVRQYEPVDWWFAFKFNADTFPQCGGPRPTCLFDRDANPVKDKPTSQQFVFASHTSAMLAKGEGCIGDTTNDPVGATFNQVYTGRYYYIVWNDQFYDDPKTSMCSSCKGTAHSKGMLAWNDEGEGFVLQVSTPSWPGAASRLHPRKESANTLGCIMKPNNIMVSQHFFALRLSKDDLLKVIKAIRNASVVTDPSDPQISKNGGPRDVRRAIASLGQRSGSTAFTKDTLSSGVIVISKPGDLHVPPWQMVSAVLDGIPLRVASWWNNKKIFSTSNSSKITCWDHSLPDPGPVEIALTGRWEGTPFELKGGGSSRFNHAKIGVSLSPDHSYVIVGDMNQEGSSSKVNGCDTSQNGRGGLFYVVANDDLHESVSDLLKGEKAPLRGPQRRQPR